MPNTNCLEGLKCPECGNEDRLLIDAWVSVSVTDDGSEPMGDHYWDRKSFAMCPDCDFEGELRDFEAR